MLSFLLHLYSSPMFSLLVPVWPRRPNTEKRDFSLPLVFPSFALAWHSSVRLASTDHTSAYSQLQTIHPAIEITHSAGYTLEEGSELRGCNGQWGNSFLFTAIGTLCTKHKRARASASKTAQPRASRVVSTGEAERQQLSPRAAAASPRVEGGVKAAEPAAAAAPERLWWRCRRCRTAMRPTAPRTRGA